MKIIGLGANLPSRFGSPEQTLQQAVKAMAAAGLKPLSASRIWKTAPVPFNPGHPWYKNAVLSITTDLAPFSVLDTLLEIERQFGRVRSERNAPRLIDLDLIAYNDEIIVNDPELILPHPRMHERGFVLLPLSDITQDWKHPKSGLSLEALLANLPPEQRAEPLMERLQC